MYSYAHKVMCSCNPNNHYAGDGGGKRTMANLFPMYMFLFCVKIRWLAMATNSYVYVYTIHIARAQCESFSAYFPFHFAHNSCIVYYFVCKLLHYGCFKNLESGTECFCVVCLSERGSARVSDTVRGGILHLIEYFRLAMHV